MNWLLSTLLKTSSNQDIDVADAKNGNQKMIFSPFQCPDLTICTVGFKPREFRFAAWDRIKQDIELLVAINDIRDISALIA